MDAGDVQYLGISAACLKLDVWTEVEKEYKHMKPAVGGRTGLRRNLSNRCRRNLESAGGCVQPGLRLFV